MDKRRLSNGSSLIMDKDTLAWIKQERDKQKPKKYGALMRQLWREVRTWIVRHF